MLKKIILRFTPITHTLLTDMGFAVDNLYYEMKYTDLIIYVHNGKFYYWNIHGKKKRIRNMLQVSNLVYGKVEYLS